MDKPFSQEELHELRKAAEAAWDDDTRHPSHAGHPCSAMGQCFVTAAWLQSLFGGHIAKSHDGGHFFWLSPHKMYALDLTGDRFITPPELPALEGVKLDPEDEGVQLGTHHSTWRTGPILHKKATHPLFAGWDVVPPFLTHERAARFVRRANVVLDALRDGHRMSLDLGDAYPGETPQYLNDHGPGFMHDDPMEPVAPKTYNVVYANGEMHVSADDSHDDLSRHALIEPNHTGPFAAGYVTVTADKANWQLRSNVGLHGLMRVLKEYGKTVGWEWGGLADSTGQPVNDDFAPKKSLHYAFVKDRLFIGRDPVILRVASLEDDALYGRIDIHGKVARVGGLIDRPWMFEAVMEWADDQGFTVMAGDNVLRRIEDLQQYNLWSPTNNDQEGHEYFHHRTPDERAPGGVFKCPDCSRIFPNWHLYIQHRQEEEPEAQSSTDVDPATSIDPLPDMDKPIPANFTPMDYNNGMTAKVAVIKANRSQYHAYMRGFRVGRVSVNPDNGYIIGLHVDSPYVANALLKRVQRTTSSLWFKQEVPWQDFDIDHLTRVGFVRTSADTYRWAADQDPSKALEGAIPFIYDVDKDKIHAGAPGSRHSDIVGRFTPAGIVEGLYEPGGKVIMRTITTMPYTVRHMLELWYYSYPQLVVKSVHLRDDAGKDTKLARTSMAERSGSPDLDNAIEAFMAQYEYQPKQDWGGMKAYAPTAWADLQTAEGAHGRCYELAEEFAQYCQERGLNATTSDGTGPEDFGYHDRTIPGLDSHHWTWVTTPEGEFGVDWTAAQFGYSEFPMVQRRDGNKWNRNIEASSVPMDQLAYIAEGAMERGGFLGERISIPEGPPIQPGEPDHPWPNSESPAHRGAYGPEAQKMSALASSICGFNVQVKGTNWLAGGTGSDAHGEADITMNTIALRPESNMLTLLHECAHLMRRDHGHDEQWARIAHDLYAKHLSQEAADIFAGIMWPDQRTAMAQRSGNPQLDALIEQFQRDEHEYIDMYRNAEDAAGNCAEVTDYFVNWLHQHGVHAFPAQEPSTRFLESNPHFEPDEWGATPDEYGYSDRATPGHPVHDVAMIEMAGTTYMVDWTASQYGYSEFPMVQQLVGPGHTWERNLPKRSKQEVGQFIANLVASDDVAYRAYQALKQAGGRVYAVGGCVRDALLGKDPKDVDLMVTGLAPEAVKAALKPLPGNVTATGHLGEDKTVDTSHAAGVFHYREGGSDADGGSAVEIALPRRDPLDGPKLPNGRPDPAFIEPDHTMTPQEDFYRRDFTVNAMGVDLDTGKLIDPFGGADDLAKGTFSALNDQSLSDDPLRTLRGLGLRARHGLEPDERTRTQMERDGHGVASLPGQRIQQELDKVFKGDEPHEAIRLARNTGLLKHFLPEVDAAFGYDQQNPHHEQELGEHLLSVLKHTSALTSDPDLRLAALLHDIGKPASRWNECIRCTANERQGNDGHRAVRSNDDTHCDVCGDKLSGHYYEHRVKQPDGSVSVYGGRHEHVGARMAEDRLDALRYPSKRISRISDLIAYHMFPGFDTEKGARRFLNRVGDHADDLLTLRQADQGGKTAYPTDAHLDVSDQRALVNGVRQQGQAINMSSLAVNGRDIINHLGIRPGPAVGQILNHLTEQVVDDPTLNERDALLRQAEAFHGTL